MAELILGADAKFSLTEATNRGVDVKSTIEGNDERKSGRSASKKTVGRTSTNG